MDYRNSIKCKYCAHFQASTNKCYLSYRYDKSIDKDFAKCDGFYQQTDPDSRCSHFTLDAHEVIIKQQLESIRKDGTPPQRSDNSYIVQIPDYLRRELEEEEQEAKHFHPVRNLIIGILLFFLIPVILVPLFMNMDAKAFIILFFVAAIVIRVILYFRNR